MLIYLQVPTFDGVKFIQILDHNQAAIIYVKNYVYGELSTLNSLH